MSLVRPSRRTLLRAAVAAMFTATFAGIAPPAAAHKIAASNSPRIAVMITDRATGHYLPVYNSNGQSYIEGAPGREYAIRLVNTTPRRVLAVTSVDGVNVISGDTASPDQTGYVIEPHGSVEITGWRKSMSRTAAFFFSEHSQSYAARTGRPFDVGVIGVAVFEEKFVPPPRISQDTMPWWRGRRESASSETLRPFADNQSGAPAERGAAAPPATAAAPALDSQRLAQSPPTPKLGTGHGRSETSHVRTVAFERASTQPAEVLAFRYDRHENLVALGVIPRPQPHYANRSPQPFPGSGLRFAPDPN